MIGYQETMKLIYRAADITEAHIVAEMLNARGLHAYVSGHYLQGGLGEIGVQNFAMVHVEDGEVEQARELIADYERPAQEYEDKEHTEHRDPQLDQSGALHSESSRFRRFLLGLVTFVLIILSWFLFGAS